MVVVVMLMLHLSQLRSQRRLSLQSRNQLLAGEIHPGSCDDGSFLIVLPKHFNGSVQLCLGDGVGSGQDDGGGGFNLVVVKLTKVLHIDFHLAGIRHSNGIAKRNLLIGNLLYRADHIGQLSHAGWLNNHPIGVILLNHPVQRPAKITHQAAADTAGVHLRNIDARILQEAAVDADFSELVLDQNQLLPLIGFRDHFLDQRCFAGSQKAGINVYLSHIHYTFHIVILYLFFRFQNGFALKNIIAQISIKIHRILRPTCDSFYAPKERRPGGS